jgi:PadR family transcriptional regulator, regulatory protein PadR
MPGEAKPTDLVQGTLYMLILKTLALEPNHAYGIGTRIGQILERDGMIEGVWRVTENNRRAKVYRLTAAGRAKFKDEARDWELQTAAISRILKASLGEV